MRAVPDISQVAIAFGDIKHLPPMKEIPEEFHRGRTKWNDLFGRWFYSGLPGTTEFYPKEGVDPQKAIRAVQAIMCSFEPKHEHKEAGVAFLLSEWFEDVKVPAEAPKATSDG